MGLRTLSFIVAVALITGVWSSQSWEGDHVRSYRAVPEVKIAAANTEADSDSKAKDGIAASSSSTKGSAAFISKHPHPDIYHHEEKNDHFRSERSVGANKIAAADTDAKSDTKAGHGMAASQSSTNGSAAFVSKNHHGKNRRSARSVEIAVADTDAKSDSKAGHGMASSSSSTKGNAAFVSKHHHDMHHHDKHRRSARDVKIAVAETEAVSDSKSDHGMASSSSSTKGNAAFVSKHHHDKHHYDKHRRSARDVKIAVAETEAVSDSKAKDGMAHSSSATKGSAAFVTKGNHNEEKEIQHDHQKEGKDEMEVAVETPEDHKDNREEMHRKDDKEITPREPFIDLKPVKEKIKKLVKDSVDF